MLEVCGVIMVMYEASMFAVDRLSWLVPSALATCDSLAWWGGESLWSLKFGLGEK